MMYTIDKIEFLYRANRVNHVQMPLTLRPPMLHDDLPPILHCEERGCDEAISWTENARTHDARRRYGIYNDRFWPQLAEHSGSC